jgi:PAS domain-containing protein
VTAAIRDISVRKDAEKHLAQMEGRYRGLLEAAPDAMVVSDSRGQILLINAETERVFGYSREELIGQTIEVHYSGSVSEGSSATPAGL